MREIDDFYKLYVKIMGKVKVGINTVTFDGDKLTSSGPAGVSTEASEADIDLLEDEFNNCTSLENMSDQDKKVTSCLLNWLFDKDYPDAANKVVSRNSYGNVKALSYVMSDTFFVIWGEHNVYTHCRYGLEAFIYNFCFLKQELDGKQIFDSNAWEFCYNTLLYRKEYISVKPSYCTCGLYAIASANRSVIEMHTVDRQHFICKDMQLKGDLIGLCVFMYAYLRAT